MKKMKKNTKEKNTKKRRVINTSDTRRYNNIMDILVAFGSYNCLF